MLLTSCSLLFFFYDKWVNQAKEMGKCWCWGGECKSILTQPPDRKRLCMMEPWKSLMHTYEFIIFNKSNISFSAHSGALLCCAQNHSNVKPIAFFPSILQECPCFCETLLARERVQWIAFAVPAADRTECINRQCDYVLSSTLLSLLPVFLLADQLFKL